MSDKPISVGDLVAVVKPTTCCGNDTAVGRHFIVGRITSHQGHCRYCRSIYTGIYEAEMTNNIWVEVSRLKRIPPPEELGIVDEREELTA